MRVERLVRTRRTAAVRAALAALATVTASSVLVAGPVAAGEPAVTRPVATIPMGSFIDAVAVTADGRVAYAVGAQSREVTRVDLEDYRVTKRIPLPRARNGKPMQGWDAHLSADGRLLYVASNSGNVRFSAAGKVLTESEIIVIDTATNRVTRRIPSRIPHPVTGWRTIQATCLAPSPDGTVLYVSATSRDMLVLDLATGVYTDVLPGVGSSCTDLTISPDGSRLARLSGDGRLSIVDPSSRTLVSAVRVARFPHGLAQSPDGSRLFVAARATLLAVDPVTGGVQRRRTLPQPLCGLAVSPDGGTVIASYAYDGKDFDYGPPDFRQPEGFGVTFDSGTLRARSRMSFGEGCPEIVGALPRGRVVAITAPDARSLSVYRSTTWS